MEFIKILLQAGAWFVVVFVGQFLLCGFASILLHAMSFGWHKGQFDAEEYIQARRKVKNGKASE